MISVMVTNAYFRGMVWVCVAVATFCIIVISSNTPVFSRPTTQYARTVDERVPPPVRENAIYCDSTYLGCYLYLRTADVVIKAKNNFMTVTWCLNLCNSHETYFAGLVGTTECVCTNALDKITRPDINATNHCNIPCPGNKEENCAAHGRVRAFLVKSKCVKEPITQNDAELRHRGCFEAPQNREDFQIFSVTSSSECLEVCERLHHPMALFDAKKECLCGKMYENFNLKDKSATCKEPNTVQAYRTWTEDVRCGNVKLLPGLKHNRTLLTSYPGSGNTWIRYLLEKASGHYTGSHYSDRKLYTTGFLGEIVPEDDYRVDLIKNHLFLELKPNLDATILIIRSPYRAMMSDFNYNDAEGAHTGLGDLKKLMTAFRERFVTNHLKYWNRIITSVLESKRPYLVMYFEDIIQDPIGSVRKMLEFTPNPLLHPTNLEDRLFCLSQDTTGLQKREHRKLHFNPFGEVVRGLINKNVVEMREVLKKAGVENPLPPYEDDPDYAH